MKKQYTAPTVTCYHVSNANLMQSSLGISEFNGDVSTARSKRSFLDDDDDDLAGGEW